MDWTDMRKHSRLYQIAKLEGEDTVTVLNLPFFNVAKSFV